MKEPSIQCLGVYIVPCDDAPWREDLDYSYRSLGLLDETEAYRRRVISIVLVEVVVSGLEPSFDAGRFQQFMERDDWSPQVAYDEALLSPDGRAVTKRGQGCANGIAEGRVCFFLHYYDPTRPIEWSFGEFTCPEPLPMTERLARLVPYRPI